MLQSFDHSARREDIAVALSEHGGVIVTGAASMALLDQVLADFRVPFDAEGHKFANDFNGYKTRRLGAILGISRAAADLIAHPLVMEITDIMLKPHCSSYRIGSSTAIEILGGEAAQELHRDDTIYPMRIPGVELQIGVMWALDDFTAENGATRVVPNSHRFLRSWHLPDLSLRESAVMPAGSALFYLGSTWHGGGANNSSAPRAGLINTYSLGWLRQESNHYLELPPSIAVGFTPRQRALLGYTPHGSGDDCIGKYDGTDCPAWLSTPPEPAWRDERGQVGTAADAKAQIGD